jgi:hypothetical protein
MKISVLLAGVSVGLLGVAAAYAAGTPLNIRLGLWEMTTTGEVSGVPPIPPETLARMTPEQRARAQAAMAARMAQRDKPEVRKQCVTKENLERGFDPKNSGAQGCHTTITSSSAQVMEMKQECSGQHKFTGTFHFEAPTPVTVVGKYDMVMSAGPNTMTMKLNMSGKWLGADCGAVK